MKLALAACDHFWLLNQARILLKDGYLETYYATRIRESIEKIPSSHSRQCLPVHYALRIWQRSPSWFLDTYGYFQICRLFDNWLKVAIDFKCIDALVVMSGFGLETIRRARGEGVTTFVECGSTHPSFQNQILLEEFRRNGLDKSLFPKSYRNRVLKEFAEANYITLPSQFVINTFLEHGFDTARLIHVPYGVSLETFSLKTDLDEKIFRVICPSGVNLRKGARVLVEAWRKLAWTDAELHWIGAPGPETHHLFRDPLPQCKFHSFMDHVSLAELYKQCDVFTLPSFEEGFARVMLEAAACGLPLIVTPNTGAEDFFTEGNSEGWLVSVNDVDALCTALTEAKANRESTFQRGQKAALRAKDFSWLSYGEKIIANYRRILEH